MLLFTRRVGEEIIIDKGQIQIKVLRKKGGSLALGITAPRHIEVDRKEIYLKKHGLLAREG